MSSGCGQRGAGVRWEARGRRGSGWAFRKEPEHTARDHRSSIPSHPHFSLLVTGMIFNSSGAADARRGDVRRPRDDAGRKRLRPGTRAHLLISRRNNGETAIRPMHRSLRKSIRFSRGEMLREKAASRLSLPGQARRCPETCSSPFTRHEVQTISGGSSVSESPCRSYSSNFISLRKITLP